jgi:predicted permease
VCTAAIESAALVILSAATGLTAAYAVADMLIAFVGSDTASVNIAPDVRVFGFVVAIASLALVLVALVPAWRAGRVDLGALAMQSSRLLGDSTRLRRAATTAQVALTIVLVTTGALFVDTLNQFRRAPLGWSSEGVRAAQLSALPGGYPRGFVGNPYYRALVDRVRALPGVGATALAYHRPLTERASRAGVAISGSDTEVQADQAFVTDDFFSTLDIPLIAGHSFGRSDEPTGVRTAILSESLARSLFGSSTPIDRTIRVGNAPFNQALRIIAVARDAVLSSPQGRNTQVVYLNYWQFGQNIQGYATLLIKTDRDVDLSVEALQAAVREGGREYVSLVRTAPELLDGALLEERLLAVFATAFAGIGLFLAAVGLYGVLSIFVARRTAELGLRMALGATRRQVAALVMREVWMFGAFGVVIGAPLAWTAKAVITSELYNHAAVGIAPVPTAVLLMVALATVAVWLPTYRATTLDPVTALRRE